MSSKLIHDLTGADLDIVLSSCCVRAEFGGVFLGGSGGGGVEHDSRRDVGVVPVEPILIQDSFCDAVDPVRLRAGAMACSANSNQLQNKI